MASETIYSCDHCNKTFSGHNKLYPMTLIVRLNNDGRAPSITREVCNECISEFGFENKDDKNYVSNYVAVERNVFGMAKKFFGRSK